MKMDSTGFMICLVLILFGLGSAIFAIGGYAVPSQAMNEHFISVAESCQIVAGQSYVPIDIESIPEFTGDIAYWYDKKEVCVHHCDIDATYGTGYGQIRSYWIRISAKEYEEIFKPYLLNECSTYKKRQYLDYINDLVRYGAVRSETTEFLEYGSEIK